MTCGVNLLEGEGLLALQLAQQIPPNSSTRACCLFFCAFMLYILEDLVLMHHPCNGIVTPSAEIKFLCNHLSVVEFFSTLSTSNMSKTYIEIDFT